MAKPAKQYNIDFSLRQPSSVAMRAMRKGEVLCFSAGKRKPAGQFGASSNATRTATYLKMKITQRTSVLVDPVTYAATPVLLVKCLEPCKTKAGKRGRKPGGKNHKKDVVPDGGT